MDLAMLQNEIDEIRDSAFEAWNNGIRGAEEMEEFLDEIKRIVLKDYYEVYDKIVWSSYPSQYVGDEVDGKILLWELDENVGKELTVYSFIFDEGYAGRLEGYNRGPGPIMCDIEGYEDTIGIYTDNGDYHCIIVDLRDSKMSTEPTFRVAGENLYYAINHCLTSPVKIDPKTGNIVKDEISDSGKRMIERVKYSA